MYGAITVGFWPLTKRISVHFMGTGAQHPAGATVAPHRLIV
jgi:hypothetical protein